MFYANPFSNAVKTKNILLTLVVLVFITSTSVAVPLTGSGSHLAILSPNPRSPLAQARTIMSTTPQTGWTGGWTTPVSSSWLGTYTASGPVPTGNTNPTGHASATGITLYDFTSLLTGELPAGTYFYFGDVDLGSTLSEVYTLSALDSSGSLITSPWLDEVIGVAGTIAIVSDSMPAWSFNAGVYTIDGSSITSGNPNIGSYLPSNIGITSLEVTRSTTFQNFALYAPVPEPTAIAFLALGSLIM